MLSFKHWWRGRRRSEESRVASEEVQTFGHFVERPRSPQHRGHREPSRHHGAQTQRVNPFTTFAHTM